MCGINGYVGSDKGALAAMNQVLEHRGPDFAGAYSDQSVQLGHTLLSIRGDRDKARQPYISSAGTWILSFNGQIYNTKQLLAGLPGPIENPELDTAVLFAVIKQYGWDFINHIHGMFAIALYNTQTQEIRLYRDPAGQKGLYYYHHHDSFIFSSELQALLTHPKVQYTLDTDAVAIATSLGYIPGTKTLFNEIKKVQPSECIRFDLNTKTLTTEPYQNNTQHYFESRTPTEVFQQLITEHLQSKERVSINLSGGLDSSLLMHEMATVGHPIHSYTTRFAIDEGTFNTDADLAKQLAQDYQTEHQEIVVTKQTYFDNFVESYTAIEEPNFNISLPIYLQTAKVEGNQGDKNRVVLSGDGGDEVFAGYPYYLKNRTIDWQRRLLTPWLYDRLKNARNHSDINFGNSAERWFFIKNFYAHYRLAACTFNVKNYVSESAADYLKQYAQKSDSIYRSMLMDRVMWLASENFIRTDKLYMSQSLEMRAPLAFHPFRMYFDALLKSHDYMKKAANKIYLRNLYTDKLPRYITHREDKTGWRAPIQYWYDQRFKDLFLEILSERDTSTCINWPAVRTHVERTDQWPGKYTHLYLSLAILAKRFNLDI